ncbi:YpjP family protein [Bacillus chungangensis]|uniref:Cell division protein FtsK n=1 Tax=Bacillus chungangensis TaxID=587633 RepID=A0ABT9WSA0_9BACI|nr:YpjP family protein [Bacillus chungangensis]MDQ0176099.1 hypothetical protein [Bacillus chungangensis]
MKKWMRKSLIVIVSLLTFGIVTPSHALWSENQEADHAAEGRQFSSNRQLSDPVEETVVENEEEQGREAFMAMMMEEAVKQSFTKFGKRISPVIADEFRQVILPNIQHAIEMTASQYPDEELSALAITEAPGGGMSEKIFNIYHVETMEDIIKFHVRRDHPPLDGYYFNFHYHTYHDQFQTHYELGTIFWDKNTPPQWMSGEH